MRARAVALVTALALSVAPLSARADRPVLDDAAPFLWLVAPTELGIAAGLVAMTGDTCESWGCGILLALTTGAGLAIGIVSAVVAAAADARGDVPLVAHLGVTGGSAFGLTALGVSGDDASATPALAVAGVGAVGLGTFAVLERDLLLREPLGRGLGPPAGVGPDGDRAHRRLRRRHLGRARRGHRPHRGRHDDRRDRHRHRGRRSVAVRYHAGQMRPGASGVVAVALVALGGPAAAQELTPPQLRAFVQAEYPRDPARQGLEAEVVLRIDIDATGSVTDVLVVEPAGNGFDEAAVAAARQFEFDPARRGDQAIAARILYRYRFTLATVPVEPEPGPAPTIGTLRGWVLDRLGEPVVDALVTLRVEGAGRAGEARTDGAGGFLFQDLPASAYVVEVAAAGYRILATRELVEAGAELRVRYRLREEGARYESVTRARVAAERDLVRRTLTPDDMRRVPGTSGDALAAVQALPGVARPPLGLGLFIIRGSPPDDTQVLLEEHPIPLPYHLGGLSTVVTSDLVESIDLLPGSFSVRHGRAAGGIVDIQLRTPRRDRFHGSVDIDLVDAGLLAETPIGDRAAVAVAVRRSYIDAVLPIFFPDDVDLSFTQLPVYWDYQLLGDLDLARDHGVRLIVSGSDDLLGVDLAPGAAGDPAVTGFRTYFAYHQVTAQLESRLNHGVVHRISPAFTWSRTAANVGDDIQFDFASSLVTLRQELDVPMTDVARLRTGLDLQTGPLDTEVRAPQPPDQREAVSPIFGQQVKTYDDPRFLLNLAVFAEIALSPGGGLEIVAGARVDRFGLIDAVTLDPRVQLRWRATSRLVWKAGMGVYSQPPRGYEVVPGFGNPDLLPERSVHYAVGFERKLAEPLTLDVELFAKTLAQAASPDPTDGFASTGFGRSTGLETMLVLRPRLPAFGWISYTLSRSERRDRAGAPSRLFEFDQTHIFSLVAGVLLPGGIEAGVRTRYTSGFPETPVQSAVYDADYDVYRPVSDPGASSRIPPYFALDLRIARRWRAWGARWTLTAEVQNATVHSNPERRVYQYDYRDSAFTTGIPILPNLGLRAEM